MTEACVHALDHWGDYDRHDPFPLFAEVRAAGAVHDVTLADGHRAELRSGITEMAEDLAHAKTYARAAEIFGTVVGLVARIVALA